MWGYDVKPSLMCKSRLTFNTGLSAHKPRLALISLVLKLVEISEAVPNLVGFLNL